MPHRAAVRIKCDPLRQEGPRSLFGTSLPRRKGLGTKGEPGLCGVPTGGSNRAQRPGFKSHPCHLEAACL